MSSPKTDIYDIAIAGAGAAGLTLIYKLLSSSLSQKKILVIDKNDKTQNDRTWCFWTNEKTGLEPILFRKWKHVIFKNKAEQRLIDLTPYEYHMIRGIDYYRFVKERIGKFPNVTWVIDNIKSIEEKNDIIEIRTEAQAFRSYLVFNSLPLPRPQIIPKKHSYLLQHFKGYSIKTKKDQFNPDTPYLMDFGVEQKGEVRFGYVLPFDSKSALVEFTLFSKQLLPQNEYTFLLEKYIRNHLEIDEFEVKEEEFGIIPMTDYLPEKLPHGNIVPIGTRGGMTKASTGYTFKNILDECSQIVKHLENGKTKVPGKNRKHSFYDSVLLHVLAKNLHPSDEIFSDLFLKNDPIEILRFLDEKSTILEDIKILSSLPAIPFLKATWYYLFATGTKKI